jgi:hypothetical protein
MGVALVVAQIRVALLDMKPKLRDILVDAIGREPDLQLVPAVIPAGGGPLVEAAPDALLCESRDPGEATVPARLLNAFPHARVLMVAAAGDRAVVFELRPHRHELADVSMGQLINAIRRGLETQPDSIARS